MRQSLPCKWSPELALVPNQGLDSIFIPGAVPQVRSNSPENKYYLLGPVSDRARWVARSETGHSLRKWTQQNGAVILLKTGFGHFIVQMYLFTSPGW